MIKDIGLRDIAECPHCGQEFIMNDLNEEDLNDFDRYFEHVTTCG